MYSILLLCLTLTVDALLWNMTSIKERLDTSASPAASPAALPLPLPWNLSSIKARLHATASPAADQCTFALEPSTSTGCNNATAHVTIPATTACVPVGQDGLMAVWVESCADRFRACSFWDQADCTGSSVRVDEEHLGAKCTGIRFYVRGITCEV
ncbi:hypothetical protein B0A52_04888 [Exophiala mesophila]|uniref:Uncharacterized protein n=1 Tax=Exophiala mesophila TaxID=212818 RepID=A0A438N6N3_EXOME|nr:hypothetical protein B0A52_04888 [Exophiala mesophila]